MTEALPASTIMLCRDHKGELQVLLLRRSKKLNFAGGFWVFPGGKVENSETERGKDDLDAAKIAAVRETKEETSVDIFADDLFFSGIGRHPRRNLVGLRPGFSSGHYPIMPRK